MTTREKPRNTRQNPTPPTSSDGADRGALERLHDTAADFMAATDEAIGKTLSSNSEAFLEDVPQTTGQ